MSKPCDSGFCEEDKCKEKDTCLITGEDMADMEFYKSMDSGTKIGKTAKP